MIHKDDPIATITKEWLDNTIKARFPKHSWPRHLKKTITAEEQDPINNEIKQLVKITDYDSKVKLGQQCCPFHSDKNPSFSIFDNGHAWNCYSGCGGGDIFNYVMTKECIDFPHAKELLMKHAGIVRPSPTWKTDTHKTNNNKQKKEKEMPKNYASTINTPKKFYEQGYDPKKRTTYFLEYDKASGTVNKVPSALDEHGIIWHPIIGDEVYTETVKLPVTATDYGSTQELLKEIRAHIHKWLDIDEQYEIIASYQILFSWVYQRFNTLNYTRALGDTGTGKSRFLNTLGDLHYKPMMVGGALTPAFIFRIIDKWKGTLIIDEGDQDNSDESNAFIKIMNCGYEKGMSIGRCDQKNANILRFYSTFCPKVITTRKRFKDKATESRCMTTIMTQTNRLDIKDTLTESYFVAVRVLRAKLLMYRFKNYDSVKPEGGYNVDLSEFEPRLRQVNRGYLSLFSDDVDAVSNFLAYLHKYQESLIEERADSEDGRLVNVLAEMLGMGWKSLGSSDVKRFIETEGIEFKEPPTVRKISNIFKGLGVEIKVKKCDGKAKRTYILERTLLQKLFSRYVYDEGVLGLLYKQGYSVTQVTQVTEGLKDLEKKNVTEFKEIIGKDEKSDGLSVTRVTRVTKVTQATKNCIEDIKSYLELMGPTEVGNLINAVGTNDEEIAYLLKVGELHQIKPGLVDILK